MPHPKSTTKKKCGCAKTDCHAGGGSNSGPNIGCDCKCHKKRAKKKEVRKYKGGGFVMEEHPEPGVVVFSMNGKGFFEEFGKPFIKHLEEKQKPLLPNKKVK